MFKCRFCNKEYEEISELRDHASWNHAQVFTEERDGQRELNEIGKILLRETLEPHSINPTLDEIDDPEALAKLAETWAEQRHFRPWS